MRLSDEISESRKNELNCIYVATWGRNEERGNKMIKLKHSICVSCGHKSTDNQDIMNGLEDPEQRWYCHDCSHEMKALLHGGLCPVCSQSSYTHDRARHVSRPRS